MFLLIFCTLSMYFVQFCAQIVGFVQFSQHLPTTYLNNISYTEKRFTYNNIRYSLNQTNKIIVDSVENGVRARINQLPNRYKTAAK